jgi:hypothetical protein
VRRKNHHGTCLSHRERWVDVSQLGEGLEIKKPLKSNYNFSNKKIHFLPLLCKGRWVGYQPSRRDCIPPQRSKDNPSVSCADSFLCWGKSLVERIFAFGPFSPFGTAPPKGEPSWCANFLKHLYLISFQIARTDFYLFQRKPRLQPPNIPSVLSHGLGNIAGMHRKCHRI